MFIFEGFGFAFGRESGDICSCVGHFWGTLVWNLSLVEWSWQKPLSCCLAGFSLLYIPLAPLVWRTEQGGKAYPLSPHLPSSCPLWMYWREIILKSISRKLSTPLLLPASLATEKDGANPAFTIPLLRAVLAKAGPHRIWLLWSRCITRKKETGFTGVRLYLNYCSVTWEVCKSFLELPGSSQSTTWSSVFSDSKLSL